MSVSLSLDSDRLPLSPQANWVYCSESVYDLLGAHLRSQCQSRSRARTKYPLILFSSGFEPHELIGTSSLNLVHPDEFSEVKELHFTTISQDQAAVLAYLRMRHKDSFKGYILCGIVGETPELSYIAPLTPSTFHSLAQSAKMFSLAACPLPPRVRKPCTTRRLPKRSRSSRRPRKTLSSE